MCICSDISGSGSALYDLFAFLDWALEWVYFLFFSGRSLYGLYVDIWLGFHSLHVGNGILICIGCFFFSLIGHSFDFSLSE